MARVLLQYPLMRSLINVARLSVVLAGLGAGMAAADASDWNLILNGKAFHLNASEDWNEQNWGLGLEREFTREDSPWVPLVLGNGFRDSGNHVSYMLGGGVKRRFWLQTGGNGLYLDLGLVGFMMSRRDVNGSRPFPGVLPAVTVGTRRVALNVTYMPEVAVSKVNRLDPTLDGVVFLQLKLDPGLLRPRGARAW